MDRIRNIELSRFGAKIRFDSGSSISVRKKDVSRFSLTEGFEADIDELCERLCSFQFSDAYESALDILDRSAKTEHEIRAKLALKGYLPKVADAVCERLSNARLIDDKYIAERIVSSMSASGKGRYAVKQKLRSRGITAIDAEDALLEISDDEQNNNALLQAKKLERKYAGLEAREKRMKLSQALVRRGFSYDSVEFALERLGEIENAD